MKNCLLFFLILSLAACSNFSQGYNGRPKHNPKDFKERREPRDNQYIASGGLKKKTVIVAPGEGSIIAGDVNANQNSKTSTKQNSGFSQKMLNISKQDTVN